MYRYKYFPTGLEPPKAAPDPSRRGPEPHKPLPVPGRRISRPDLNKTVRVVGSATVTDNDQTVKKTYDAQGTTKPKSTRHKSSASSNAVQNGTNRSARRPRRVHGSSVRKTSRRRRTTK